MSFNLNISEGTCYFSSGNEAPSRFIPCGNSQGGHVPCCESQDNCLSSNACYNPQYGVTYLAGCTDSSYDDPACPNKGDYSDQTWVGLVYCNGTSNKWTGCGEDDDAETVGVPQPCWCPQTATNVLFEAASVLDNLMQLPTGTGESVKWLGSAGPSTTSMDLTPSAAFSSSALPTSSVPNDDITSRPSMTSPANVTSAIAAPKPTSAVQQPVLTPGAQAGIGVAAAVGGLASLIILALLIRKCMGKKGSSTEEEKAQSTSTEHAPSGQGSHPQNGDLRSPAWSGHKSELPANESTFTPSPTYADFGSNKSAVEGSPALGGPGRPISNGGYEMPGQKGAVFEMPG